MALYRTILLLLFLGMVPPCQGTDFTNFRMGWPFNVGRTTTFTARTLTCNESGDYVAFVFQVPEAVTVTGLGFRYGARTGTPPTYKVTLEGVGTTGLPNGTDVGGGSPTATNFTPPADTTWNSTWRPITLGNSFVATRGQYLAFTIRYSSGTINGTNSSSFATHIGSALADTGRAFPYAIQNDASGSATRGTFLLTFSYSSSSKVYGSPVLIVNTTAFNSTTTPDEYALKFSLPSITGGTYKVSGVDVFLITEAATLTVTATLYDTDGTTVLQQVAWDSDVVRAVGTTGEIATIYFDEATLATLNFGSSYRISITTTATASTLSLISLGATSNAYLSAFPGGINWHLDTRTDSGAWTWDSSPTTVNLTRPIMGIILDDVSFSGGGSGGSFTFVQ